MKIIQSQEEKARAIIREELKSYLIQEGFWDTIKGFGKKIFGNDTDDTDDTSIQSKNNKLEYETPPEEESIGQKQQIQSLLDKDANDMLNGYYFPINSEEDIDKAIQSYSRLEPQDALTRMFKYLLRSMTKRRGNIVTQKEKQIYGVLIDDIEKALAQEDNIKENMMKNQVSSNAEKMAQLKKFMIPASLWGKTAIAFSDFIFDELIGNRNLSLKQIFKNTNLQTSYNMLKDKLQYKPTKQTNNNNMASKNIEDTFLQELKHKWTKMI